MTVFDLENGDACWMTSQCAERSGKVYRIEKTPVKVLPLRAFSARTMGLQPEIFVLQPAAGQLGGAGGHPLQRVVAEGGAVGSGGHDALFGTDHLSRVQFPSPGAVGAAGLDGCLKQIDGGSPLMRQF